MFDTLTSVDEHGNTVPILAARVPSQRNGDISRDGKTIVFHLRRGVFWQDGAPFTSRDVLFTFRAIMDPRNNTVSHSGFQEVHRIWAVGDDTVAFELRRPFAPIVQALFGESDTPYPIMPAHLLEHEPDLNRAAFNAHPVGTGPFRLVRWQRGDHLDFDANPRYFRGKPRLAHIRISIIPDENTEIAALQAHEIDWYFEPSARMYAQLRTLKGVRTMLVQTNQFAGMLFNTARPPLDDVRIRRAIALSIDKAALVRNFTNGSAVAADQDLPPWIWASSARAPQPPAPGKAQALLREAGYRPGADGMLQRDGKPLSLQLSYPEGNVTYRLIAVDLQARLHRAGIEIAVRSYPASLLFAPAGMGGILARGTYDLNLSGWVSGVDPDDSTQFSCSARPPAGSNVSRLCDPAMDVAQDRALSRYDRPTRKAAYAKIEQLLADDVPELFFYYPRGIQGFSSAFAGFAPNSVTESWNAFQWTISSPTNPR